MKLLEWVVSKGYEEKVASSLIKQGKVIVNSEKETLINYSIKQTDQINILHNQEDIYVSRGAHKLLTAIKNFDLNLKGKIVLDVGSSTGGFTQVSLLNHAQKVYAVDVGTNQLHYSLRSNKNVVVMEKTNLKSLTKDSFKDKIDIIVCDVSFISVKRVFDIAQDILEAGCSLIALIKPQYEANSNDVDKGGFVEETKHNSIIKEVKNYASEKNFLFKGLFKSPIKGKKSGNQEYVSFFIRSINES